MSSLQGLSDAVMDAELPGVSTEARAQAINSLLRVGPDDTATLHARMCNNLFNLLMIRLVSFGQSHRLQLLMDPTGKGHVYKAIQKEDGIK